MSHNSCHHIISLLSEYLSLELSEGDVRLIEQHMTGCPPCEQFLDSLKRTLTQTRSLKSAEIPKEVASRLQSFLRSRTEPDR